MDTVHIAIPAVGPSYEFYANVAAESARRHCSLPIEIHLIGEKDFARVADISRFGEYHGSSITWSRLYLPEMFPELDWIISADADVMFRGDVSELWSLREVVTAGNQNGCPWALPSRDCPMPGEPYNQNAVGWYVARGLKFDRPEEYFCAGLTLFNLRAMREGEWAKKRDSFLEKYIFNKGQSQCYIESHQFGVMSFCTDGCPPNADQCVLNYLLQGKIQLLPRGWGVFSGDENADIDWGKPGAVHFVDDQPWKRVKVTQLESDLVVEWKKLANELGGNYQWKNWRRAAFVFFKHNQWILKLNHKLWLHLRSTRGIV